MEQLSSVLAFVGSSLLLSRAVQAIGSNSKCCNTSCKSSSSMPVKQQPKFLSYEVANKIRDEFGTPVYVYDETSLIKQANAALNFPAPYGLKVRYAMKACPNNNIRMFQLLGLNFDASSGYEVNRALNAGIPPTLISLSAQELPDNFKELMSMGVLFNACSMLQLEEYGKLFCTGDSPLKGPASCGIRFNPGIGSGGTGKTNVGGPAASFGVWHAYIDDLKQIATRYNIEIIRVHTHIGSGSDPKVWQSATYLSLAIVKQFPSVHTLNLGGGFKVARVDGLEKSTDLQTVGAPVKELLQQFATESGRKLNLEIEPGTFLLANAGCVLASVQDIADTSRQATSGPGTSASVLAEGRGYRFLKLNSGMTELLRPSLYGAQHPILLLDGDASASAAPTGSAFKYVVVGHCCESGDLFSCEQNEPEVLREEYFARELRIGDLISLEGSGAYCSSMSTKNYNSFPEAPEVLLRRDGSASLMRRKQALAQITENETKITF